MRILRVLLSALVVVLCGTLAMAEWTQECVDVGACEEYGVVEYCFPDGSCGSAGHPDGWANGGVYIGEDGCDDDNDGDGIDDICGCTQLATACCLPDGCQDEIEPTVCETMGGMPFGACSPCTDVQCPVYECIGATGSCDETHGGPGCDQLCWCNSACTSNPECCDLYCGNGIVDPGEECDDGNNDDGDGCSANCIVEQLVPATSTVGLAVAVVLLLSASAAVLLWRRRSAARN